MPFIVTPAQAGVQNLLKSLDTGLRRYDELPCFVKNSKLSPWMASCKIPQDANPPAHESQRQKAGFPLTLELMALNLPEKSWLKISQIRTLSVEMKRMGRQRIPAIPLRREGNGDLASCP
jgi:hypothetical protein